MERRPGRSPQRRGSLTVEAVAALRAIDALRSESGSPGTRAGD